jgi:hypothetical protein
LCIDGFIASLLIDGPMNGVTFNAYMQQMLASVLKPRDILILDSLLPTRSRGSGRP